MSPRPLLADMLSHDVRAIQCACVGGATHELYYTPPSDGLLSVQVIPERAAYEVLSPSQVQPRKVLRGGPLRLVFRERGVFEGRALVLLLVLGPDSGPLFDGVW